MRKSIVFDKNTPDVFYCPQHKPIGFEKMLVKARPLSRLCQFEGRPIPEDYKSDCYNDVDETEYACKEKYRIMVSESNLFSRKPLYAKNASFIQFIKKLAMWILERDNVEKLFQSIYRYVKKDSVLLLIKVYNCPVFNLIKFLISRFNMDKIKCYKSLHAD